MSELERALLTSAFSVIGGVLIFVFGQIVVKFLIEPLHEQAKIIGDVTCSLTFYANTSGSGANRFYIERMMELEAHNRDVNSTVAQLEKERYKNLISDNWKKADSASELLRKQASDLLAKTHSIPFYSILARCYLVPKFADVLKASSELIGLSNSVHNRDSDFERTERIAKLLRIQAILK